MGVDVVTTSASTDPALRIALNSAWQILANFRVTLLQTGDLFHYFESLDNVLTGLNEAGAIEAVDAAMSHIDYLAEKAGCLASVILGGGYFTTDPQVILDTLANIGSALRSVAQRHMERPPEGIPEDVFALILEAEAKLAGWCSREKAMAIAGIVLQERPTTCVEIGVFGGRSLIPCAAALRHIGEGAIYGIEAWSPHIAVENPTNDANDDWWSQVDFTRIKQEFFRFIGGTNLSRHVRVVEAPSNRAASLFDQIDYLHIDGSHSMLNAAEDVLLYARKVRSGGMIIFDDINWQSTGPARELLGALCETVAVLKDPDRGLGICAVLRRR